MIVLIGGGRGDCPHDFPHFHCPSCSVPIAVDPPVDSCPACGLTIEPDWFNAPTITGPLAALLRGLLDTIDEDDDEDEDDE